METRFVHQPQSVMQYRPLELEATLYDGGAVPCVAFCSPQERLIQDGLPPPDR